MFAWDYTEMASCWCSLCSFFYAQVDTIRWSDILMMASLWISPWNSPFEMTDGDCYNAYVLPLPPWWRGWWCPWCVVSVTDVQGIRNSPSGREWVRVPGPACAALSTRGSLQLTAPVSSCSQTQVRDAREERRDQEPVQEKGRRRQGVWVLISWHTPWPGPTSLCPISWSESWPLGLYCLSESLRSWGGRVRSARV